MNHIRCVIHGIPKDLCRPDIYVSPNGDHKQEFKMRLQYHHLPIVRDRVLLDIYMGMFGCLHYDNGVMRYGSPPIDSNWRQ